MIKTLVIDDNEELLQCYQEALQNDGHDLFLFNNPLQALSLLNSEKFDLIVTDLRMPGISGQDLLLTIRKNPLNLHCPIVVVSDYMSELKFSLTNTLQIGRIHFVAKPFAVTTLKAEIDLALESGHRRNQRKTGINEID